MYRDLGERLLWPRVELAVVGRPVELAVPAEMRAEHARIGPPSARVDTVLADGAGDEAAAAVAALRDVLEEHLRHEEATALPLEERQP